MKKYLHSGWIFRESGKEQAYPADVPGCIHTDLLKNGLIPDPFYGTNEKDLQWIGKTGWEYTGKFSLSEIELLCDRTELVFEGLDTYAEVILNGKSILKTENMFRKFSVECREYLKVGINELKIVFDSPINKILPMIKNVPYKLPSANDMYEGTASYTRKAQYHYGWDWGPRFVTCGIWRPVFLQCFNTARIDDVQIIQKKISPESAEIDLIVRIDCVKSFTGSVTLSSPDGAFDEIVSPVSLPEGLHSITLPVTVENPELWWPNGLGSQRLYRFHAAVAGEREIYDEKTVRTGLRTVKLNQEKDEHGKKFEFIINGMPVFCKGANWIPADSFVTAIETDRYRELLESCRDAHFTMLRVWGGGIYEHECFYELCDEMGLFVWQDFMFACAIYPIDEEFTDSVKSEAEYQVRRLRHHPSIALWCGNNEIEAAIEDFNWPESFPQEVIDGQFDLFYSVLPEICAAHDPDRPYWPGSPSSNREEKTSSQNQGDMHYWGVWHGKKDFTEYTKQMPRFMSEYGFQSFPLMESVKRFCSSEQYDIESPTMLNHQKNQMGNQLIREYLHRSYPDPKDFFSFLFVSQVQQAEAIKYGAEHFRRILPRCMGGLYWQVNDCWPVASWAGIDYYGNWKALHFYAKRFYAPVLISGDRTGDLLSVFVQSDLKSEIAVICRIALYITDGTCIREEKREITLSYLSVKTACEIDVSGWLSSVKGETSFFHFSVSKGNQILSENFYYPLPFRNMELEKPDYSFAITENQGGKTLTIRTSTLARGIYLQSDVPGAGFSDNFFDLFPGVEKPVRLTAKTAQAANITCDNITVFSLYEAFSHDA